MKYSLVDGQRQEAQPGLQGECPVCGAAMVAKCGEIRVPHWAHRSTRNCDHWWEPETEWHRAWKNAFPAEWQETVHWAEDGEKHIADVKTDPGWVIEFQHSYLRPEERRAREAFYRLMSWVVDGTRRKADAKSFQGALGGSVRINSPIVTFSAFTGECALLREWSECRVPTLFDFGDPVLWRLDPFSPEGRSNLSPIRREVFVEGLRNGPYWGRIPAIFLPPAPVRPKQRLHQGVTGFERHMAWRNRARARRRL